MQGCQPSGSAHRLQQLLAVVDHLANGSEAALVGQLGLKAGGIQLRRRQQRFFAQGAAFEQERCELIGSDGGGIEQARFRVGCSLLATTPRGTGGRGLRLAGRRDPLQECACRLITGVLGHQLTAERLSQQRRRQPFDELAGGRESFHFPSGFCPPARQALGSRHVNRL